MVNNSFKAIPFADGENASYVSYYSAALADSSMGVTPIIQAFTNGFLSGKFPAASASYPNAIIDLYTVDPLALANNAYWPLPVVHPRQLLASFRDNGPGDLNPNPNEFTFDLRFPGPFGQGTYFAVAVSYSQDAGSFNVERAVTSPMSNPVADRPTLVLRFPSPSQLELSWLGPQGAFLPQFSETLSHPQWSELFVFTESYSAGRDVVMMDVDPFVSIEFFRLISR